MNENKTAQMLNPVAQDWLYAAPLQRLFTVFAAVGAEARVVGGAVRNALLGLSVADIDLAVNRPPEITEAILQQAGIRSVRTGFAHGTITAVIDGVGYELTSLRRDTATDGRHAQVAYTDAWAEDAARRDFTINALYVAADGTVYDYHGGLEDLCSGRVRFIGDATARLQEDYLRLLRFYRMHAYYGRGALDGAAQAACCAAAPGLAQLSRERVTQEWRKIILAPDPLPVLSAMQADEILPRIIPLTLNLSRLQALLVLSVPSGFVARFAALLPADPLLDVVLQAALRLPNVERLAAVALVMRQDSITANNLAAMLYRHGRNFVADRLLLQTATQPNPALPAMLAQIAAWQKPHFPLRGEDVLALGVTPSPAIGVLLQTVEDWWIAADFQPDRAACLAALKDRLSAQ